MMFKANLSPELIAQLISGVNDGWTDIVQEDFSEIHHQLGFRAVRSLIFEGQTIQKQCQETVAIQRLDQFMNSGAQINHDQVNEFIKSKGKIKPADPITKEYVRLISAIDAAKQTSEPEDPEDDPEFIKYISGPNGVTERCPVIHHLSYPIGDSSFKIEFPPAASDVGNRILVSLSGGVIFRLTDVEAGGKKFKGKIVPGNCITTGLEVPDHFDASLPNHFGTSAVKLPPFLKTNMKNIREIEVLVTEDDGNPATRRHLCLIDLIQPSEEEMAEMAAQEYEEEMAEIEAQFETSDDSVCNDLDEVSTDPVFEAVDADNLEEVSGDSDISVPDLEELSSRDLGHMH